jgi:hypothetical protein
VDCIEVIDSQMSLALHNAIFSSFAMYTDGKCGRCRQELGGIDHDRNVQLNLTEPENAVGVIRHVQSPRC